MLLATPAFAADLAAPYPAKSIRMVVGFPPGGDNDTMVGLVQMMFTPIVAESQRALQSPDVKERLNVEDLDPANATPAQLDGIRSAELTKWRKIVQQLGLRFE